MKTDITTQINKGTATKVHHKYYCNAFLLKIWRIVRARRVSNDLQTQVGKQQLDVILFTD